jgi:hypothetical protein
MIRGGRKIEKNAIHSISCCSGALESERQSIRKKKGGIIDHELLYGRMHIKNAVAGGSQFSTFSSN